MPKQLIELYFGICDDCDYEWEDSRPYRSCPQCGLTNIAVWKDAKNRSVPMRTPSRWPWGSGGNLSTERR